MKNTLILLLMSFLISCSSSVSSDKINWKSAGFLPAQTGFERNIGTAGVLYGSLENKYIVVGGGANFPYENGVLGGKRETYSDIYLLEDKNGKLEVVEHTNWINKIGYGASVTTTNGIYYIGGSTEPTADDDILYITLKDNKLNIEHIGDLPFTLQNAVAVYDNNKLYILAGKQNGVATNKVYSYDLNTKEVKELASIPNEATRTQPVAQLLSVSIYLFSGGDKIAYTDGYKYDILNNTWHKVSDVQLTDENEGISLLGAVSIKLNEAEMMVVGGFNKAVYDDAVSNLSTLKDTALADFRAEYFARTPEAFNWNKKVLVYNADFDSWKSYGEVPFAAPCGEGLVYLNGKVYSINGEIKPGVRTNEMYVGTVF